jgi:rhodanese-related sulfurtransferase
MPGMPLRKNHRQLVDEATARITTLSLDDARAKLGTPGVVFVDIRDVRELDREGQVPGAVHAPRGMLEFWVDPESPYHRPELDPDQELVLYCQSGWRSALATAALVDMGAEHVAHVEGGFGAWKEADLPVVERERRTRS